MSMRDVHACAWVAVVEVQERNFLHQRWLHRSACLHLLRHWLPLPKKGLELAPPLSIAGCRASPGSFPGAASGCAGAVCGQGGDPEDQVGM